MLWKSPPNNAPRLGVKRGKNRVYCREEGVTRCARDPGEGVNPMPAPSSHGSFSVSLACSLRE